MSATFPDGSFTLNSDGVNGFSDNTGGAVVVASGATVRSTVLGGAGLRLEDAAYTVTVAGVVDALHATGIGLSLASNAPGTVQRVTVAAGGILQGNGTGLFADDGLMLTVAGSIAGGGTGVSTGGATVNIRVDASGSIDDGIAAVHSGSGGSFTLLNAGVIGWGTIGALLVETSGTISVTNSGTIIGDTVLDGSGRLRNTGAINGLVELDDGTLAITNSGSMSDDLLLDDGDDRLTNSGTISGRVDMSDGADTVKNTGTIVGTIDLGGGDDRFTGGADSEIVLDADGADAYKLGAGDDEFRAESGGTGSGDGIDTVDGGAGIDIYDASGGGAVFVNLDTRTVASLVSGSLVGRTATGVDIGTDTVRNFEIVVGSDAADQIFGGKAAETLNGGAGGDELQGGGGDDALDGGDGADVLSGGLGADTVDCGLTDGAIDTIVFLSTTESPAAGFDTVVNFEGGGAVGGDWIDLRAIDAIRSTTSLNEAFTFVGTAAFSATAGEVRYVVDGANVFVQADTDGNGLADFGLYVLGTTSLISTDFLL